MKKIWILILALTLVFAFVGCENNNGNNNTVVNNDNNEGTATEAPKKLETVVVTLDWTPNTNHTGLYVALENGYFEEQGLKVEIIQPSGGTAEALVATEKAQFGISYQENVTLARLEEVPVVSIAAIIQHNSSGFASLAEKNIVTPKDFEGKKYGGWGSPIENAMVQALVEQDGGDFSKVDILTSGAVDFFAMSEVSIDFAWVFEGWTGIEAALKGIEINYIDIGQSDSDLDYYTPVIITSENLIKNDSALVEKFMTAVSMGYNFAIDQPEAAGNALLKHVPELDKELVLKSQAFLATRYQDDAARWGEQKETVWTNYMNWLFERNLIEKTIDVNQAFTNDFLPEE